MDANCTKLRENDAHRVLSMLPAEQTSDQSKPHGPYLISHTQGSASSYNTMQANGTDYGAVLSVLLVKPGSVAVDTVSLFPAENRREKAQNPWPFRRDILDLLKQLKPRWEIVDNVIAELTIDPISSSEQL